VQNAISAAFSNPQLAQRMVFLYLSMVADARKDKRTSFFITLTLILSHPGEGIFSFRLP